MGDDIRYKQFSRFPPNTQQGYGGHPHTSPYPYPYAYANVDPNMDVDERQHQHQRREVPPPMEHQLAAEEGLNVKLILIRETIANGLFQRQ